MNCNAAGYGDVVWIDQAQSILVHNSVKLTIDVVHATLQMVLID
jgi:hypothetical protein